MHYPQGLFEEPRDRVEASVGYQPPEGLVDLVDFYGSAGPGTEPS
jgi:hypothetical protein